MRWTAAFLSLLLVSCATGTDDVAVTTAAPVVSDQASTTSTSPVETTTTTIATTTTEPATTTTMADVTISVTILESEVTVDGPTSVDLGERVAITVESDVADEIHVHTYDVASTVEPGVPTTVVFTADIPGVHEIELEESGIKIMDLEVG